MALPDISGYLSSTRHPVDYGGAAIQAFQAVSSEMRATRAQNLAEEESARDLGKGIKEGMQKDRMFEEDLIDKAQMRHIRAEDQEFERQRLGFEAMRLNMAMEEHRFNMQNLMPLEIQSKQLGIERQKQIYDAAAFEMQTERELRALGNENLGRLNGLINGTIPVPDEAIDFDAGETADSPTARLRAAYNQHEMLGGLVGTLGDPATKSIHAAIGLKLRADPRFSAMEASGGLMLPSDRKTRGSILETELRASLPFDDFGSESFIMRNRSSVDAMLNLPEEQSKTIRQRLLSQADAEYKSIQDAGLDKTAIRQQNNVLAKVMAERDGVGAALQKLSKAPNEKLSYSEQEEQRKLEIEYDKLDGQFNSLLRNWGAVMPNTGASPSGPLSLPTSANPYESYFSPRR